MTEEPKVEPATPEAKLPPKDTFRILIMDTVEHTDQLKAACKDAGHSVVATQTIKEAFAFLDDKDHADVIVCAAYLEDESMFEFLRRLRTNPIHKDTMFMTLALAPGPIGVKANTSTEKAGRVLGADAFINMPVFNARQLITEIKKLLPAVPMLEESKRQAEGKKASDI
jgi:CheY-like chemotaxis protein